MWFHKISIIGCWKFQGGGSQRPKFFKESMDQNWNFQGDGEVQTKKTLWVEGMGISETRHL